MKIGLLSTAAINDAILAGAEGSDRVEVIAVGSRDAERARAYAAAHGIARWHGSYEDLLADPELDAVYVSLPNKLHHEWTLRALRAGRHVLCEKPYSRCPEEVREAFATAREQGLVLAEAFMYRHHPQLRWVDSQLRAGSIGSLRAISGCFSFRVGEPDNPRFVASLDGGSLLDAGCYPVSGVRLIAGEPVWAMGAATTGPTGVDLAFYGLLRFADDVVATVESCFLGPWRQRLEVVGSDGILTVESPWSTKGSCRLSLARDERVVTEVVPFADAYRLELENLADAIEGRGDSLLGEDDAYGQARALDALLRSAAAGRPVELG
jgi:predicted dehydrogenase